MTTIEEEREESDGGAEAAREDVGHHADNSSNRGDQRVLHAMPESDLAHARAFRTRSISQMLNSAAPFFASR